jgi:hypothetical protein
MNSYPPLWQRGARGDFTSIILKSPFIPLCQRGIKTTVIESLPALQCITLLRKFSTVGQAGRKPNPNIASLTPFPVLVSFNERGPGLFAPGPLF